MNPQHTFMHLLWQNWVHTLIQSFWKKNLICNEWRWIISKEGLDICQPVIDICPLLIISKVLEWLPQDFIQVLCYSCKLFTSLSIHIDYNSKYSMRVQFQSNLIQNLIILSIYNHLPLSVNNSQTDVINDQQLDGKTESWTIQLS